MGLGLRPRPGNADAPREGELAAWLPENEDRREPALCVDGGGFILALTTLAWARRGVVGTEVEGVMGVVPPGMVGNVPEKCSGNSEAEVIAEPVSEVAEPRLAMDGRDEEGTDGVRDWRNSIRLAREMGCTSGMPFLKRNVLTCTDLEVSVKGAPGV